MARVGMALSGGVDSTVAAYLLQEAGHQIIGLTLRIGAGAQAPLGEAPESARALGIEHHVVDAAEAFENLVLGPAARAYSKGLTPNPCAVCNAGVKFPLLWEAARNLGCEVLATGHYARVLRFAGGPALAQGEDRHKSQAYFLARLRPEMLERLLLPLGGLHKDQVREIARKAGLPAAGRAESQDGCFLPPGGWDEIIGSRGLVRPGPIEDLGGNRLGFHQGLHRYTVGQRRGLGIALGHPAYVVELDGQRATVKVGPREMLTTAGLRARRPLWRFKPEPDEVLECRVRYSARAAACRISGGEEIKVDFLLPQGAVAPGQLAVFYKDGVVAGSAWISKSF